MSERRSIIMKGLIGKKAGMTQIFNADGNAIPVTVIDMTSVVILGITDAKEKHLTKAQVGSFKKAGANLKRTVREFRVEASELEGFKIGEHIKVDDFFKMGE